MNLSVRPDSRRQLLIWLVAFGLLLAAVIIFLELAEDIWLKEGFNWDAPVMLGVHNLSQPWLDKIFWLITQTGGLWIILPVLGTAFWFWRRDERGMMWLVLVSYGGAVLLNNLLKLLFARARPDLFPPLDVQHSFSFPSGHTMGALILWQRGRHGWAVLAGLWVPLVALSRVYLGAHYPSDVLASLAIGTIWLVLVWFLYTGQHVNQAAPETK